jgi:hypothetical protein
MTATDKAISNMAVDLVSSSKKAMEQLENMTEKAKVVVSMREILGLLEETKGILSRLVEV